LIATTGTKVKYGYFSDSAMGPKCNGVSAPKSISDKIPKAYRDSIGRHRPAIKSENARRCGIRRPGFLLPAPGRVFAQQKTAEHSAQQNDKQRYRKLPTGDRV